MKPDAPKGYIDVSRVGNGAIFEGTKGSIFCDFTTRVIIPNNDDGDFTYYKRRGKEQLLPLIRGTGQPTQAMQHGPARTWRTWRRTGRAPALPTGMTGMPSAEVKAERVPGDPVDGRRNTAGTRYAEHGRAEALPTRRRRRQPAPGRPDVFQTEWIEACKGKRNNVVHGTSSKTHCDFDYAGTMIEQMLLGLVAHRAGKRLEYDPQAGQGDEHGGGQ